jgi:protein-tyrosine phosphatase
MRMLTFLPAAALLAATPAFGGDISSAMVERASPAAIVVRWTNTDQVDVLVSSKPDMAGASLVSKGDADGKHEVASPVSERLYFALRDARSGRIVKVAERLVPLEHGSNFRDIGGYPAAGGKHVRWGMIYRSGATPLLTDADVEEVKQLGIANMVDLRSSEERVIAPSRIEGISYNAIGYSMTRMMPMDPAKLAQSSSMGELYGTMPEFFAPHAKLVFDKLLSGDGPLVYNCSAGQDRTGFVTALVLTALGVPREVIIEDYHLSTAWRRPQYEMPKIDPAAHPGNPVAQLFSRSYSEPGAAQPRPLKTEDNVAYLQFALAAIEKRWGSVDSYLRKEIGLTDADFATLRTSYLE